MFKYIIVTIMTFIIFQSITPIQAQQVTWTKVYGGNEDDIAYSIKQTPDGGYIVIGGSQSLGSYYWNVWILKLDQYGDTSWSRIYDSISTYGEIHDIEVDYDSGYILIGSYTTDVPPKADLFVIKIDINGDSVWSRKYDLYYPNNGFCQPYDIDKTSDGGYIIAGRVDIGNSMGFILKLDHQGDSVWVNIGIDFTMYPSVIEGYNKEYFVGVWGDHVWNLCLINFDSLGNSNWSTGYFNGAYVHCIEQTNDSGVILVTSDPSKLIKVNSSGDTIWTQDYTGEAVIQDNDSGFVVVSKRYDDLNILKTDHNGDSVWARLYGGSNTEVGYSIKQTPDGGYIIAGATKSYGSGGYDFYIIKTDSLGNAVGVEEESNQQYLEYPDITIENISQGQVRISFFQENEGYINLSVYDLSGRIVEQPVQGHFTAGEYSIILTNYQPGVYFYCIENSGLKYQGKFQVF